MIILNGKYTAVKSVYFLKQQEQQELNNIIFTNHSVMQKLDGMSYIHVETWHRLEIDKSIWWPDCDIYHSVMRTEMVWFV